MAVADADESLVSFQVIYAVGNGLPLGPAREVVVQDAGRLPGACPFCRPPLARLASTSSFFLVSTLTTGCPASANSAACSLM